MDSHDMHLDCVGLQVQKKHLEVMRAKTDANLTYVQLQFTPFLYLLAAAREARLDLQGSRRRRACARLS